jgi:hypothetical protein
MLSDWIEDREPLTFAGRRLILPVGDASDHRRPTRQTVLTTHRLAGMSSILTHRPSVASRSPSPRSMGRLDLVHHDQRHDAEERLSVVFEPVGGSMIGSKKQKVGTGQQDVPPRPAQEGGKLF